MALLATGPGCEQHLVGRPRNAPTSIPEAYAQSTKSRDPKPNINPCARLPRSSPTLKLRSTLAALEEGEVATAPRELRLRLQGSLEFLVGLIKVVYRVFRVQATEVDMGCKAFGGFWSARAFRMTGSGLREAFERSSEHLNPKHSGGCFRK